MDRNLINSDEDTFGETEIENSEEEEEYSDI